MHKSYALKEVTGDMNMRVSSELIYVACMLIKRQIRIQSPSKRL